MRTKIWALALMFVTTLLTSTAQIFWKKGSAALEFNIYSILTNYPIWIGLAIYGVGAVLMITAFKGGELSVLYPIIATSYIWVAILSFIIFGESINYLRWSGILAIVFGIAIIGLGSKRLSMQRSSQ